MRKLGVRVVVCVWGGCTSTQKDTRDNKGQRKLGGGKDLRGGDGEDVGRIE